MKQILYTLGLFLLGISIWSITWTWLEWSWIGTFQRMIFLIIGTILVFKYGGK